VVSKRLYSGVLDELGSLLAAGTFEAGQVLRTDELETRFGVSRTVVREAVRVLESMKMVHSRPHVGVTVTPRSQWNVYDPRLIRWRLDGGDRENQLRSLVQLRAGFEPVAAGLAAHHADPQECGALTAAVMEMAVQARAGDLQAYLKADIQFHRTLLTASDNEMLAALGDVVEQILAGRTRHHRMPATPKSSAIRLHADVAEAVHSGDAAAAERGMRALLEEAATATLVETEPAPGA
jgi:DNA-binding FadR family transcriptional regulator